MRYHRTLDYNVTLSIWRFTREKDEKTTGLHEIITESNGDVNPKNFTICVTLHDTHATSPEDKRRHVIWVIYSLETYIIWKEFLRLSKISRFRRSRTTMHASRISNQRRITLRLCNTYKLKCWLTLRNSNSSYVLAFLQKIGTRATSRMKK